MSLKPIKLWTTAPGPNGWKVLAIIEELNLPYEVKCISFEETKLKPFTDINPNGRVPAIEDPNTDLALWESGAIIQYLVEQYDTTHRLSYTSLKERNLCNQWLAFQISGQGPYYGQIGWFNVLHPERLPSAVSRFTTEARRILGVLDGELAARQWLVGDKMTFADLAFVHWNQALELALQKPGETPVDEFVNVKKWHERMLERPALKKTAAVRQGFMVEQGIVPLTGLPEGQTFQEALRKQEEERKRQREGQK